MQQREHQASKSVVTVRIALVALVALTGAAIAQEAKPTAVKSAEDAPAVASRPANVEAPDPQWLQRMSRDDRALLDGNIGYALPEQTDELRWVNHGSMAWEALRGKVVVLQSWTSRNSAGRQIPQRLYDTYTEMNSDDVQMIAVHTPDGADTAEKYLERQPSPMPVVIDPSGRFCDELGFYRMPLNVIVDRHGVVRYAGIRMEFVADAVKRLLAEPMDPSKKAEARPVSNTDGGRGFPVITGTFEHARDVRGQKAPEFYIERWVTRKPDARNKVVVIDFWATWCGWCIYYLPHTNELADKFRNDAVFVGLSDETESRFTQGMEKLKKTKNLTVDSFHYPLALDPQAHIKKAINITGIPHMIVMSSDWIVRWQGHPKDLTEDIMAQIIAANHELTGDAGPKRYRWSGK